MSTDKSTVNLTILKASLKAGGLLREMTENERMAFGYAPQGAEIAYFETFIFIEDADGMYLEVEDKSDSNGFQVVATLPYGE